MIRWEYKVEDRPRTIHVRTVFNWFSKDSVYEDSYPADMLDPACVVWLNKHGADGWEMVEHDYHRVLFRRQVVGVPYRDAATHTGHAGAA